MSAVSKKLMPASSAASTTAVVASWSMRMPKLLHPRPTTVASSEPIRRVFMDTQAMRHRRRLRLRLRLRLVPFGADERRRGADRQVRVVALAEKHLHRDNAVEVV